MVKSSQGQTRIRRHLDRLQLGHYGDFKRLSKDLYELRLFFGPGYRIGYILRKKGNTPGVILSASEGSRGCGRAYRKMNIVLPYCKLLV